MNEILKCDHSNESYRQHFPVELFTMLHNVVLMFESADEILKCNHSKKGTCIVQHFLVVLLISFAGQGNSNF